MSSDEGRTVPLTQEQATQQEREIDRLVGMACNTYDSIWDEEADWHAMHASVLAVLSASPEVLAAAMGADCKIAYFKRVCMNEELTYDPDEATSVLTSITWSREVSRGE